MMMCITLCINSLGKVNSNKNSSSLRTSHYLVAGSAQILKTTWVNASPYSKTTTDKVIPQNPS